MYRRLFIALCVLGLYSCSQQRPAVIERPVFDVCNSTTLEIDKIEISDSATIFHIDAYFRPHNWIRIDKGTYIRESGSEEKLLIKYSEGINLDEGTYMPESGTISFKLFFPPLKPEVAKIDFIESDCDDCFKIWGIHLLPNAKIKFDPIPKDIAKISSKPLPAPGYSLQPTKVSGKMLGYVNGIESDEITIYTTDIISGEQIETTLPIAEDGTFSGEITPGMAGMVSSSIGSLFLVPGEEVKIYTDLKKRSRYQSRYRTDKEPEDSIYAYISGCFTNAELDAINLARSSLFDYEKLMHETVNMKPAEFQQHILGIVNEKLDEIKQKNYSANTLMMMENSIKLQCCNFLMLYEDFINSAYMQVNNIKREDRDKVTFKPEKPDETYYLCLNMLNDNMSYISYRYINMIEKLIRIDFFNLSNGSDKPAKERFAYFKEKFAPVSGASEGILFDMIKAKIYGQQLSKMKFYTDAEKQEIRDAFNDNAAYAETLIAENDRMEALIAANKENGECVAYEPPQVSQEKMFDAILANYRGKVVMVDFWATWCGPCMAAMKNIKPLKDEMKDKDVVFLYLTGETSPLVAWAKTYPTISGEHYRVSAEQWTYWYKTYGIEGIPTYMIYDRQGNQLARYTGYPGNDTVKNDIIKGL